MSINDLLDSEWVLPVLIIIGLAFFIGIPLLISKKEKAVFGSGSDACNERVAVATIVDKRSENDFLSEVTYVVFEFEDGTRIDLAVRNASTMIVGDKGHLRYNGKRFISFQITPNNQ